ncbi:MAG: hypothetical protein P4L56_11455 [Candidatus Sulfopaludibacter sp.]|nr:hypothetical protein [Candidatus Sulfopaludibacter sp.]
MRTKVMKWVSIAALLLTGFLAIALLFDPLVPVFRPAGSLGLSIVVLSFASIAMAWVEFPPRRLLCVAPIAGSHPGSQSL